MKGIIRPNILAVWIVPVLFVAALVSALGGIAPFHGTAFAESHDVPRGQLVRRSLVGTMVSGPSGGSMSIGTPGVVVSMSMLQPWWMPLPSRTLGSVLSRRARRSSLI
jgi:hypothetical protein